MKDTRGEGLVLYESHAILRYLCDSFPVPDHWYPKDPEKRAKVNEYLDSHHSNLRRGGELIFLKLFMPFILGPEKAKKLVKPNYLK